jgi:hypothetical protein
MSNLTGKVVDVQGDGQDRAVFKTTYTADDYVAFQFTDVEDYYVIGLMAYLSDPSVPDLFAGWGLYRHGQPAAPIFLVPLVGPVLPPEVPSFETKFMRCISDQDCWIRFGGPNRIQHFIPANIWVEFRRRTNMIFVVRNTVSGTLGISFYG